MCTQLTIATTHGLGDYSLVSVLHCFCVLPSHLTVVPRLIQSTRYASAFQLWTLLFIFPFSISQRVHNVGFSLILTTKPPDYGCRKIREARAATLDDANKSIWRLPECLFFFNRYIDMLLLDSS